MNPLRALLAALVPEAEEHAARTRDVATSLKAVRADIKGLRRDIGAVVARAEAVSRQVAQVRQLQHGRLDTPAVLDELAALLATDRVLSHVRAAVARASAQDGPDGQLVIDELWPGDVYQALTAAIPDPVFFEGPAGGAQTLRVPPRLAPAAAIAAWTFVADLVEDVIVPAVAAQAGPVAASGALDITPGRLVRRPAGSSAIPLPAKPWHWGMLVMDLTSPHEASPTANTAVAYFTPGLAAVAPVSAPAEGVHHSYEVWFGSRPA